MIAATGLSRHFGEQRVLDGLSLSIAAGERVALLGLNGSGKTTLFRCLLGLIPYDGDLAIDGLDVERRGREARARIGYVPQRPPHFPGSLGELVAFFSGLRGLDRDEVASHMAALDLSLDEHADKPVRALSGGMLQKTLLALATAAHVPLLLLDEPTANLDPRARRDFVRALGAVPEGTTVFLSSHRLEDIQAAADRLLLLHRGRIVFDGSFAELESAAGIAPTLWLELAPAGVDEMAARLEGDARVLRLRRNGTRLGLRAPAADLAALLSEVGAADIEILDLRTEAPSLERLLHRYLEAGPA